LQSTPELSDFAWPVQPDHVINSGARQFWGSKKPPVLSDCAHINGNVRKTTPNSPNELGNWPAVSATHTKNHDCNVIKWSGSGDGQFFAYIAMDRSKIMKRTRQLRQQSSTADVNNNRGHQLVSKQAHTASSSVECLPASCGAA
jgi:hypothetical protein